MRKLMILAPALLPAVAGGRLPQLRKGQRDRQRHRDDAGRDRQEILDGCVRPLGPSGRWSTPPASSALMTAARTRRALSSGCL